MIAQIFHTPILHNDTEHIEVPQYFFRIVRKITQANSEAELTNKMLILRDPEYAKYFFGGFGGHHLWIKQVGYPDRDLIQAQF